MNYAIIFMLCGVSALIAWFVPLSWMLGFKAGEPPPAPARGIGPPVTWEMTFWRAWPCQSQVTLYREFPEYSNVREVAALWTLEMAGTGWTPDSTPRQVPPEAVRCSD